MEAVADNLDPGGVLDLFAERRIKWKSAVEGCTIAADFLEHSGFDDVAAFRCWHYIAPPCLRA